jgi:hypothetical protein
MGQKQMYQFHYHFSQYEYRRLDSWSRKYIIELNRNSINQFFILFVYGNKKYLGIV